MSPPIQTLRLTVEEFDERFQPERSGPENDYRRYEPTNAADLAHLQSLDPARVWTVVYTDDPCTVACERCTWEAEESAGTAAFDDPRNGVLHVEAKIWLTDGFHYVNRDYCVVTTVPCPPDTTIDVPLDD